MCRDVVVLGFPEFFFDSSCNRAIVILCVKLAFENAAKVQILEWYIWSTGLEFQKFHRVLAESFVGIWNSQDIMEV